MDMDIRNHSFFVLFVGKYRRFDGRKYPNDNEIYYRRGVVICDLWVYSRGLFSLSVDSQKSLSDNSVVIDDFRGVLYGSTLCIYAFIIVLEIGEEVGYDNSGSSWSHTD